MDNYRIYNKERNIYLPGVWDTLEELVHDIHLGLLGEVVDGMYIVESVGLEKSVPLENLIGEKSDG